MFVMPLLASPLFTIFSLAQSAGAVECKGVRPLQVCPGYDTKQSDGKVPVTLEHWGMQITPSSPSLPCPLRPGVVTPDRVQSMDQIELNSVLMLN